MDEALTRKLLRQVRLLNFLIISSTLVFLALFAVAGYFGYQAMQEVRRAQNSLNSVQTSTSQSAAELQDELCSSDGTLSALIKNQSDICN